MRANKLIWSVVFVVGVWLGGGYAETGTEEKVNAPEAVGEMSSAGDTLTKLDGQIIEEIRIEGKRGKFMSDKAFLALYVTLEDGRPFSCRELKRTIRKLKESGFFDYVTATVATIKKGSEESRVVVVLHVMYRRLPQVFIGGGYGDLNGFAGQLGSRISLGANREGYWYYHYGQRIRGTKVRTTHPDFMSPTIAKFETEFQFFTHQRSMFPFEQKESRRGTYDLKRKGATFFLNIDVGAATRSEIDVRSKLGYGLERVDVGNFRRPDAFQGKKDFSADIVEGKYILAKLFYAWRWNTAGEKLIPSKGLNAGFQLDGYAKGLGSDFSFVRFEADWKQYFNPFWKVRLKTGAALGYETGDVPFYERFYSDTIYRVRSFKVREQVPEGGKRAFIAGMEWGVPFFSNSVLPYLFFDVGHIWNSSCPIEDVAWTPGIGLEVMLPMLGALKMGGSLDGTFTLSLGAGL